MAREGSGERRRHAPNGSQETCPQAVRPRSSRMRGGRLGTGEPPARAGGSFSSGERPRTERGKHHGCVHPPVDRPEASGGEARGGRGTRPRRDRGGSMWWERRLADRIDPIDRIPESGVSPHRHRRRRCARHDCGPSPPDRDVRSVQHRDRVRPRPGERRGWRLGKVRRLSAWGEVGGADRGGGRVRGRSERGEGRGAPARPDAHDLGW